MIQVKQIKIMSLERLQTRTKDKSQNLRTGIKNNDEVKDLWGI